MNKRLTWGLIAFLWADFASAQGPAKRPEWDQKLAIQKVKNIIALEEKSEMPWDKIAWMTDPAQAAALARKEQKPIFVFFFLKKDAGPTNAPC